MPQAGCWLDTIAAGSREYAKQVEERLKPRVFRRVVPRLAEGFLADRKARLCLKAAPADAELEEIREGCLTLLYRLLFLLYAECRDLLPIREAPYVEASLRKIKEEIAAAAGDVEDQVEGKLSAAYRADSTTLYDRLCRLFAVMDMGDPALNVPTYNGGLFLTKPDAGDAAREAAIARFLAQAIDQLSRDPDEKTFGLVFTDRRVPRVMKTDFTWHRGEVLPA